MGKWFSKPSKQQLCVAITIPHAKCPPVTEHKPQEADAHVCDTSAVAAAKQLINGLMDCPKPPTISVWEGNVDRSRCDLNRQAARSCAWRPDLLKWLKLQRRFWVVDVHSFPAKPGTWGKGKGYRHPEADTAELVLLDTNPNPRDMFKYTWELKDKLVAKGFKVVVLKGEPKINAITSSPLAVGAERVFLLEFSEKLENGRLAALCKAVSEALCAH